MEVPGSERRANEANGKKTGYGCWSGPDGRWIQKSEICRRVKMKWGGLPCYFFGAFLGWLLDERLNWISGLGLLYGGVHDCMSYTIIRIQQEAANLLLPSNYDIMILIPELFTNGMGIRVRLLRSTSIDSIEILSFPLSFHSPISSLFCKFQGPHHTPTHFWFLNFVKHLPINLSIS